MDDEFTSIYQKHCLLLYIANVRKLPLYNSSKYFYRLNSFIISSPVNCVIPLHSSSEKTFNLAWLHSACLFTLKGLNWEYWR